MTNSSWKRISYSVFYSEVGSVKLLATNLDEPTQTVTMEWEPEHARVIGAALLQKAHQADLLIEQSIERLLVEDPTDR